MSIHSGADLILVDGKIVTLNRANDIGEAVAIKEGRIVGVGSNQDIGTLSGKQTRRIELEGRTVTPGFVESHCHPPLAGTMMCYELDMRQATSIDEIIHAIRCKAEKIDKGKWLKAFGYNDGNLKEKRHPTKLDLDGATTQHPVFLGRMDGHLGVANSLALKLAGITAAATDPPGGRFDRDLRTGDPNGVLRENALNMVTALIPPYEIDEIKEGIVAACRQLAQWGFTSFNDAWVDHDSMTAYQELLREDKLPLRVGMMIVGIPSLGSQGYLNELSRLGLKAGFGNDRLSMYGTKFICDGSLSGWTAALHEPYSNDPHEYGITLCSEQELTDGIVDAHLAGLRPVTHAIGDRAIDMVLNAIEKALDKRPDPHHRMSIEHCSLPTEEALERIQRLGVLPSSSVGFIYELGSAHALGIGPERLGRYFPHRTYLEKGIISAGNSDWPVTSGDIARQLYGLVTRKCRSGEAIEPQQAISVMDALKVYTINGAYAAFEENVKGSIELGKVADMAILDRDVLDIPVEELKDLKIDMTLVGGKIVYQRNI